MNEAIHAEVHTIREDSRRFERRYQLKPLNANVDYAWLCSLMHPTLSRERVQIASDVVANWFHHDDHVDEFAGVNELITRRSAGASLSPTEGATLDALVAYLNAKNENMIQLFAGNRPPHPLGSDALFYDSCADLATRIRQLGPTLAQLELWLTTLRNYFESVVRAKQHVQLDVRSYLKLREDTGAAPALIALGLLLEDVRDGLENAANRRGIQLAGLLTSLHNDFFSLKADVASAQRENVVVIMGGSVERAQERTNELMQEYLRAPVSPGIRHVCDAMIIANFVWCTGGRLCPGASRYQ
ncbi:MAG: hypothetical protein B7733_07790 [Myxococcales bacterium FL481]|nr:MAG: hypothetical protein B7733_07790 [Myxococcales bacterium FL481]